MNPTRMPLTDFANWVDDRIGENGCARTKRDRVRLAFDYVFPALNGVEGVLSNVRGGG